VSRIFILDNRLPIKLLELVLVVDYLFIAICARFIANSEIKCLIIVYKILIKIKVGEQN